ncbi:MAG TPA: hypothetical protein VNL77_22260, partial [Roseiflexaceae bacterium]|nr:hypothetical protein [Roseiflexaceae bacterium]
MLIRARLLIVKNTFWRGRLASKLGALALVALAGFGAWLVYTLMRGAVLLLTSPRFLAALEEAARTSPAAGLPADVRPYLAALPGVALFAALVLLVFTSFGTVLSSLYLSGDLDMLVAAPVPLRAVFVVKLFGGLVTPYLLLFVVLGPALVGYGQGLGYGPAFFAAAALVLLLFPLLPTGLGALLVMAVVRVVPARRARDIVSVLGGLLGVSWYVLSQLSPQIAPRLASVRTLEGLRALDVPLLPSAWAGRALVAAGEGEWLTLAAYGGLFAALSLAVFAACLLLAERLYYIGWANMASQGGRARRTTNDERRTHEEASRWSFVVGRWSSLSPPAAAIMFKDLRVFPRDLRNLQQVIFPLALAGIWTFQLLSGGPGGEDGALARAGGMIGPAGISFFVCMSLSSALGGSSVSREGRGFWLLKVAPVSARQILLGKLAIAYLPYPTAGALFLALLAALQGSRPLDVLAALGLVLLAGLGTSAITLGMGAAFPRFDWENPQQQHTMPAGCLAPILYMVYLALAAALALGAPALAAALAPQAAGWLTALAWALL